MTKEHIQVQGVELIKQGTNTNGPWHLYRVLTPEKKYSTFLEGLQIGQEYDVLVENKPFKGQKDGKMHDGWTITGFDNVVYEAKQERPVRETITFDKNGNTYLPRPTPKDGFTDQDRATMANMETLLEAIYESLNK